MATVVSQHVCHLGRLFGLFKNFIFSKTAGNFFELSRKHVFIASKRNIFKSREKKKKIEQTSSKHYRFYSY